jgi:predicted nucleic acid-binding protein
VLFLVIVLDASVLIAFMFEQDEHHAAAVALLRNIADQPLGAS